MGQDEELYTGEEEEDVDTGTDEDDPTGKLDDDMFFALSQRASSLCSTCRQFPRGRFLLNKNGSTGFHSYHPSLSSLQKSVDAGCHLCIGLTQSLEIFLQIHPQTKQAESWSIKCSLGAFTRSLQFLFVLCDCDCDYAYESDQPGRSSCEHALHLQEMNFSLARRLGLGPEFLDPTIKTSSAKSARSFAVARSWYQQCLDHPTCRNWRQESRALPTRLIEIWRPDNQPLQISAKLCETKALATSTRYATLSHCWGEGVIFKLLQNNVHRLSREVPMGQLPKVFQDAIQVSLELGISYIWIDSLCIIQDSKEDWEHEAKRMGGVYSNGEFNIAATGYEDGASGLFGERKALPLVHTPLYVDFVLVDEKRETEAAHAGIYVRADEDEFRHKVTFGPLNDRAWVAQERTLSPAIIHYTPEKIYWECNQSIASEAFLNGAYAWRETTGSGRDRIRSLSRQSERQQIYSFWRTFINRYAGMEMTFNRDRFPAVAGIARLLGELIDDNLIAGFWEGDLIRSLVMERHIVPRSCIMPEQLAPSWSWASLCAGASAPWIDEAQFEPLEGVCFRVLSDIPGFKSDLQSPSFEKSGVRGLAIKGALRKLPDNFDNDPEWIKMADMNYDNRKPVEFLRGNLPQEQAWRLKDPTHMLLLAKECSSWVSTVFLYGLLIQFADLDEANTFRRSGTVQLCFDTGEKANEYLGLREKDGEYEPSLVFEERGLQDLVLL